MSEVQSPVELAGDLLTVTFDRYDLDAYPLFLRTKSIPEAHYTYDHDRDRYLVTAPARFARTLGFDGAPVAGPRLPLAGHLFDYQRWIIGMALVAKRFAAWCDTGLGKTMIYLEYARQATSMTSGRGLILAPLAVIPQVIDEARRFYGDTLPILPLSTREAMIDWCRDGDGEHRIAITNYEKFIPGVVPELRHLAVLVADESSLLKTGGGVIKWNLIKSARGIEYKLSCTATPAPNDAMEYASQAAFLEKLRSEGDILWSYFTRDKRGEWRVKPHAKAAFYAFMATWSVYLRDPVRFGFADILATLPAPETIEERLPLTDEQRREMNAVLVATKSGMFADDRLSVTARTKLAQIARGFVYEKVDGKQTARAVQALKPGRVAEIAKAEVAAGRPVLVWTQFDEEAAVILDTFGPRTFPIAVLSGKQSDEERARILAQFRAGEVPCLISKPSLIGYGLNLQFVKSMVFSGFDDSFERDYQAVRRALRFGQTETVRIFRPYVPELEGLVFANVREKERRFLDEVTAQEELYRRAFGMDRRTA